MKKQLESDLADLIRKYKDKMSSGDITESIIGFLTCTSCSAAYKHGELDKVEDDLNKIIKNNVDKSKKYFEGGKIE